MSDLESTPEEEMLKRHRKEKKELQAKIQNLKKTSSKGDKKKKKEVLDEIAKLENELNVRQKTELQSLHADRSVSDVVETTTRLNIGVENSTECHEKLPEAKDPPTHVSKAQKRRERKEQLEKERIAEIKAQEELNKQGPRHLETTRILQILKDRNLALYDIPSNGDCLFAAICHQANGNVLKLRHDTVHKIKSEKSEYLPFLTHPETGQMLTNSEFDEYCKNMAETKAWGGQIELRAISDILGRKIEVLQAEGPPVIIGENLDNETTSIILTYHKHYLGLGEHYNSTKVRVLSEDEKDE